MRLQFQKTLKVSGKHLWLKPQFLAVKSYCSHALGNFVMSMRRSVEQYGQPCPAVVRAQTLVLKTCPSRPQRHRARRRELAQTQLAGMQPFSFIRYSRARAGNRRARLSSRLARRPAQIGQPLVSESLSTALVLVLIWLRHLCPWGHVHQTRSAEPAPNK